MPRNETGDGVMAHMSENLQTIIRILIFPIQVIGTLDRDKTRKSCDQIYVFPLWFILTFNPV